MPSSNETGPPLGEDWKELLAKLKVNEEKLKKGGHVSPDYGELTVNALNRHTTDPEWSARYMRWLEDIGPNCWTPVAKADYQAMKAQQAVEAAPKRDPPELASSWAIDCSPWTADDCSSPSPEGLFSAMVPRGGAELDQGYSIRGGVLACHPSALPIARNGHDNAPYVQGVPWQNRC